MSEKANYDEFAWVYNRHWDDFGQRVLPVVDELLLGDLRRGSHILDVCCGAGQLAHVLLDRGYKVTGFDISEQMIACARRNAPQAEFFVADACNFSLPAGFDAAVSTFDSLNHILDLTALESAFRNVHDALRPGGVFLFDMNTEEGYLSFWEGSFSIVEEDHVCIVQCDYHEEERSAEFHVTIFRLQDVWRRSDMFYRQKCHSEGEVLQALHAAGFDEVSVYGYDYEEGLAEADDGAQRLFFLCRKAGQRRGKRGSRTVR